MCEPKSRQLPKTKDSGMCGAALDGFSRAIVYDLDELTTSQSEVIYNTLDGIASLIRRFTPLDKFSFFVNEAAKLGSNVRARIVIDALRTLVDTSTLAVLVCCRTVNVHPGLNIDVEFEETINSA